MYDWKYIDRLKHLHTHVHLYIAIYHSYIYETFGVYILNSGQSWFNDMILTTLNNKSLIRCNIYNEFNKILVTLSSLFWHRWSSFRVSMRNENLSLDGISSLSSSLLTPIPITFTWCLIPCCFNNHNPVTYTVHARCYLN